KKQLKGGTKNESWKGSLSTGVLSNESHPTGTCLRPTSPSKGIAQTEKLQEGNLKKETQRGLGKHGNILLSPTLEGLMWKFPVAVEMIF
ncbi:hypothetical protein TNCT_508971, partial [Trichonephila clavata]